MDCADASASYALMYAAAGNGDPPDPNSTGVKQHSLSDDHLHIHAQREVNCCDFDFEKIFLVFFTIKQYLVVCDRTG